MPSGSPGDKSANTCPPRRLRRSTTSKTRIDRRPAGSWESPASEMYRRDSSVERCEAGYLLFQGIASPAGSHGWCGQPLDARPANGRFRQESPGRPVDSRLGADPLRRGQIDGPADDRKGFADRRDEADGLPCGECGGPRKERDAPTPVELALANPAERGHPSVQERDEVALWGDARPKEKGEKSLCQ